MLTFVGDTVECVAAFPTDRRRDALHHDISLIITVIKWRERAVAVSK